jgi:photosystem I subunit VIII
VDAIPPSSVTLATTLEERKNPQLYIYVSWRCVQLSCHLIGIFTMAASFLPSILVPLTGLVFPAVAMAFMFLYIERDDIG